MDSKQGDELLDELRAVKMLLILQLLQSDVSQRQIASILGISEATMSRMIPKVAGRKSERAGSQFRSDEGDAP